MLVRSDDGSRDDERRPRLVDQDRVDLVDDGVVVPALHPVLGPHDHVVAQVVEAELVVRPVGDVAAVRLPPRLVVDVVLDDANGQPEIAQDLADPLRVAPGQVVVDRDQVAALAGERVQVERQDGDQGLSLAGRHLGDLALVQHDPADQLHVVRDHLPARLLPDHRPAASPRACGRLP